MKDRTGVVMWRVVGRDVEGGGGDVERVGMEWGWKLPKEWNSSPFSRRSCCGEALTSGSSAPITSTRIYRVLLPVCFILLYGTRRWVDFIYFRVVLQPDGVKNYGRFISGTRTTLQFQKRREKVSRLPKVNLDSIVANLCSASRYPDFCVLVNCKGKLHLSLCVSVRSCEKVFAMI